MYKTGEVIRTRVKGHPYIFHYGIIININGHNYVAHNPSPSDESETPILSPIDRFFDTRVFEKTYGVITQKTNIELIQKFNELKHKKYSHLFFNCEDFINQMIGYFRFQSGKIQLIAFIIIVGYIFISTLKKI